MNDEAADGVSLCIDDYTHAVRRLLVLTSIAQQLA